MTFDRLLYTDCRAGTGRGGGGGFQVQAQSAGVDSAQSKMAVGWLLYEAQNAWIMQRRPVDAFPLGFAHACGAGYGTAQSRYIGTEATGGRQGNHLADCLLTYDPDLYGPTRPVQLWQSQLWRAEPWDTKDCPQFADELPPGPLTVDVMANWLTERPERAPVLTRLLSVLEDPAGRRVVIVAADPDEALAWIAAATLLLPVRHALEVSFKVFSSNPLRAEQRIVAVPAELNPQLTPGRAGSLFVLDGSGCAADEAEASDRARFLVGQLTDGGDPYDVIDAVELAEVLGEGERLGGMDALLTAWALTRPGSPLPDPAVLFRWLSGAGPELQREHGPAVGSMILGAGPAGEPLRWLDDAVAHGKLELDPAVLRAQLLATEIAEARDGTAAPGDVLPPVPLGSEASRDAESELSSAILLGTGPQVDLLLRLARRHGIELELAIPLQRRLREFVTGWIDHPMAHDPDGWALRDEVLDFAHDELRDRIDRNGVHSVLPALRQLFRYFTDRVGGELSDPLSCHLQVAAAAAAPDRALRVRALLERVVRSQEAAGVQQALIAWNAVGPAEAAAVLTCLPGSVEIEPEIAKIASEQLARKSAKPDPEMLDLLASLDQRGLAPKSGRLARLLAADRHVRAFTEGAVDNRITTDPRYFDAVISLLCESDRAVVEARLDSVLQACLDSKHLDLGGAVLTALNPPLPKLLIERWGRTLGSRDSVGDGVWCVNCITYPNLPVQRRARLSAVVRAYADKLSEQDHERWYVEVRRQLQPDQRAAWKSVFTLEMPRQRGKLWINRGGGRP
jgi:hypothetical protein